MYRHSNKFNAKISAYKIPFTKKKETKTKTEQGLHTTYRHLLYASIYSFYQFQRTQCT